MLLLEVDSLRYPRQHWVSLLLGHDEICRMLCKVQPARLLVSQSFDKAPYF